MTNALAAFVLVVVALSRLEINGPAPRTVGHVAALLTIAFVGYRFAAAGRLQIAWTLIAFGVAWFWMPIVPLAVLLAAGMLRKTAPAASSSAQPAMPDGAAAEGAATAVFTLSMAANEFKGRVKAFAVEFGSIYGSHQIPVIVEVDGREHAVYVETAAWDRPATMCFYKWMAALRASDREDLPVLIRSPHPVPIEVSRYAVPTPGNAFELAGAMNVHWTDTPGWAELNAATVRRLAQEYFDAPLSDTIDDLMTLDQRLADSVARRGEALPSTLILVGCYFGEVLVKQLRGEWVIGGGTTADIHVAIATPAGTMEANVFGKAGKLLRNGIEDSMAWMARSIQQRINEPGGETSS